MNATDLNVSVLAELVAYHASALERVASPEPFVMNLKSDIAVRMPNEIPRARFGAAMNHIRRCVKAGLLVPASGALLLMPEGIAAVKRVLAREVARGEKRGFGNGPIEQMYKREVEAKKAALAWLTENT